MFQEEVSNLRDKYNEERSNPVLPKNVPPVSGRIMWIRHFYKRIEEPMDVFKTRKRVKNILFACIFVYICFYFSR